MIKYLEEALDFYLGEIADSAHEDFRKFHKHNLQLGVGVNKSHVNHTGESVSKPESKIWKLIDKWKKQGLKPQFEIYAKMLTVWGLEA